MNPIYIVHVLIQILLIVHCIRTGRNTIWILVLLFLPLAGPLAYVAVEIIPGLFGHRATRRAVRGMRQALNPGQQLRQLENEARVTGGVATRQRYAEELLRQNQPAQAVEVYKAALTGLYEHDPNLLRGLAEAQFAQGQPAAARATLDQLIAFNPGFKSPQGHLLYARALQAEGNTAKALEEFRALSQYYAGAEAPVRYAQLLRSSGQNDAAKKVLSELLETARVAPRHYRRAQREWLSTAEQEIASL